MHPPILAACLVVLVLVCIPFVGDAAESVAAKQAAQTLSQTPAGDAAMPALTNAFTLTNGMVVSFSLEYSVGHSAAFGTNAQPAFALVAPRHNKPNSEFGEFVVRHMTADQEFRFVSCDEDSSRMRKILSSVSAGYGEFFNDNANSSAYRASNGAKREFPGFLYMRSQFQF